MRKFKAVRNVRLCTKDCLCLYICPTGASDTENGQIDASKCTGCGLCVNACPSHALSLVPYDFPEEQAKKPQVIKGLQDLAKSKIEQKRNFEALSKEADDELAKKLFKALAVSNKVMAEDITREAGYLTPQSSYTVKKIEDLLQEDLPGFPKEEAEKVLVLLKEHQLKQD